MQRKYNLTQVDCSKDPAGNDPNAFYSRGRDDFKRRISHVLTYPSRHTGAALGQWHHALFSVEPENEPFGHSAIAKGNEDWMCDMSTLIRSLLHPAIAVRFGRCITHIISTCANTFLSQHFRTALARTVSAESTLDICIVIIQQLHYMHFSRNWLIHKH